MSPADLFSVDGRSIAVVGASSGIGARFASVLANAGARVMLGARRTDRLESLTGEISSSGGVAAWRQCDVTNPESVNGLASAAVEEFGDLTGMVACAGVAPSHSLEPEAPDSFRQVMEVNANGAYFCAAAAYQAMKGNGGSIVLVSSISGLVAGDGPDSPSYTASKGAVVNLARELATRWAGDGIRVNTIAPGWFRTEMTEADLDSADGLEFVESRTPLGRVGAEEELDGALLFLCSDASSYVTGQTMVVDGGWTAR